MNHKSRNMKRMNNRRKWFMFRVSCSRNSGFTLIELVVSAGLFLILVGLAAGTFVNTLRAQRAVVGLTEDMNNAAFVIEQIAREVRVGFDFESAASDTLTFTNADGDDVSYGLIAVDGTTGIGRCVGTGCGNYDPLTSPGVEIERLEFVLRGAERGDGFPPRVTILVTVRGEKDIRVNLQTTISSRILDT